MTAHGGAAAAEGKLTLPPPQLTFACELDHARLAGLFADPQVIDDLLALKARVALMCSDFSDERAGVVRRLNTAGVPVTGIPLLPRRATTSPSTTPTGPRAAIGNSWRGLTGTGWLNWQELAGDLRLARQFCDQILVHSLEGCVWQGFLPRLRSFEWTDIEGPPDGARAAAALRKTLRATLWGSAHPWPVLGITAAAVWLAWRWRRK